MSGSRDSTLVAGLRNTLGPAAVDAGHNRGRTVDRIGRMAAAAVVLGRSILHRALAGILADNRNRRPAAVVAGGGGEWQRRQLRRQWRPFLRDGLQDQRSGQ